MVLVFPVASPKRDRLLLPVLESFSLVEVLHSVEESSHETSTVLFFVKVFSDAVPKLLQSLLLVLGDHLFIATTQVQSNLSSLEPLLESLFGFHKGDVLFKSVLLDP